MVVQVGLEITRTRDLRGLANYINSYATRTVFRSPESEFFWGIFLGYMGPSEFYF